MEQGGTAPDFELDDQTGTRRRLGDLLVAGPVVLFFFPIASSNGCTAEACRFRDLADAFAGTGATVVGCSPDEVGTQRQFADAHSLDFPLLADPDGVVAAQFGVKRSGLLGKVGPVQRRTFVIEQDRTVRTVVTGERKPRHHADDALAALRD